MKYIVTYIEQREVEVIVDIQDKLLNDAFNELGPIQSDDDFEVDDPRLDIEGQAFEKYCMGECEEGDYSIVDRSIKKLTGEQITFKDEPIE